MSKEKKIVGKKERRSILIAEASKPSLRIESKDDKKFFVGLAIPYGQRSKLIYERGEVFFEVIEKGAFDRILGGEDLDVILRIDHVRGTTLARSKSKTLELTAGDDGVHFRTEIPDTQSGRDTAVMIEREDYRDLSFEYTVRSDGEDWIREDDGALLHIVREAHQLFDVTICTENGAFPSTVIDTEKAARMAKEKPAKSGATGEENGRKAETDRQEKAAKKRNKKKKAADAEIQRERTHKRNEEEAFILASGGDLPEKKEEK